MRIPALRAIGRLESAGLLRNLVLIFLLKSAASSISLGSGFRGGLFFASLFLGALLGQIFAQALAAFVPVAVQPVAFTTVGMGALAVAIIGGPLTMTFLALEVTGDFAITAAVLIAVVAASITVRELFGYSFATCRFHLRSESIRSAHQSRIEPKRTGLVKGCQDACSFIGLRIELHGYNVAAGSEVDSRAI